MGSDTDVARFDHRLALTAIKAFHIAAFFSIGGCLAYLLYSGVAKRSDRKAAVAGAVVSAEALIYAANGMVCPLTRLAERLGAGRGSVSDIFLPDWAVSHLAEITGPIFAEAVILHAKNVAASRRVGSGRFDRKARLLEATADSELSSPYLIWGLASLRRPRRITHLTQ
jgi:hypothetical protein